MGFPPPYPHYRDNLNTVDTDPAGVGTVPAGGCTAGVVDTRTAAEAGCHTEVSEGAVLRTLVAAGPAAVRMGPGRAGVAEAPAVRTGPDSPVTGPAVRTRKDSPGPLFPEQPGFRTDSDWNNQGLNRCGSPALRQPMTAVRARGLPLPS